MLDFMTDAVKIPMLLDGDTGYGNFNNVRRLVKKLEQRDVAAVCIEDKLYPKTNSFIDGTKQQLAEVDEFCSRIKAGKDAQADDDFCLITRVEAFIAGWGLDEALRRAEAYHEAGADGILIHSALSVPTEVIAFKKEWADRSPVVIVPTKYYATPTELLREAGFSIAIWANHMLRAAIPAMQHCAQTLYREQTLRAVEDDIVPVKEIFRLQGASELQEAEERYLPNRRDEARVIVLAASRGSELGDLTANRPKTMVEVGGRPLLGHIVQAYHAAGIKQITAVRGYAAHTIDITGLDYVDNLEYAETGELTSLSRALEENADDSCDVFVSYGDVIFKRYIVDSLAEAEADIAIVVDTEWQSSVNRGRPADYVSCSEPYSRSAFYNEVLLECAAENIPETEIHGEWMGFLKVSKNVLPQFRAVVSEMIADPANRKAKMHHLLSELVVRGHAVRVIYTTGHWLDVDSISDVLAAGSFA
jgi:phosphoenolpyruvate phosphomutase